MSARKNMTPSELQSDLLRSLALEFSRFTKGKSRMSLRYPVDLQNLVQHAAASGCSLRSLQTATGATRKCLKNWLTPVPVGGACRLEVVADDVSLTLPVAEEIRVVLHSGVSLFVPLSSMSAAFLTTLNELGGSR